MLVLVSIVSVPWQQQGVMRSEMQKLIKFKCFKNNFLNLPKGLVVENLI